LVQDQLVLPVQQIWLKQVVRLQFLKRYMLLEVYYVMVFLNSGYQTQLLILKLRSLKNSALKLNVMFWLEDYLPSSRCEKKWGLMLFSLEPEQAILAL